MRYSLSQCQAMPTSEKLCLRWNDFQENVNSAFRDLRKDFEYTDVTLACKDGHQVEAHKVILSASSPFFQKLLKRNKHAHPLIYMRGINSEDLMAIVDFLYYGEADIYQENLETFLKIAEEFQLKGLNGKEYERGEDLGNITRNNYIATVPSAETQRKNDSFSSPTNFEEVSTEIALSKHDFSRDMKDLNEKIKGLMCRGENMISVGAKRMDPAYICKVCGKEGTYGNLKVHIEAKHLEGTSVQCNLCEKTFASRDTLRTHTRCFHRDAKNNQDN